MAEQVGYITVTNTGTVLNTQTQGQNYVYYGYSLKTSGATAVLSINDNGTYVDGIPAQTGATASAMRNNPGVVLQGVLTVTGVSTNLSALTIYYSKI
jgi:hypothetical protein